MTDQNKRLAVILAIPAFLLLIPLVAMQFSSQVKWSPFDFAIAAVLLYGSGLLCELVLRKFKKTNQRIILCAVILVVLVLVWLELAVGIFGSPFAGS